MHAFRTGIAGLLVALLTGAAAGPAAAASSYDAEQAEPVPRGAELAERCAEYRDELAFTRAQLKERNLLGRWDFLVAAHRKREKFVAEHCGETARDDAATGDQARHDAAHSPAARVRSG